MRRSGRGVRYALVGYALISLLVLGGMAWATIVTWRLAKLDLESEEDSRRQQALEVLDSHLGAILAVEGARDHTDYVSVHMPIPILSRNLEELEPSEYVQPSPITLFGPPHPWIELYFQVDQDGHWSSPQLPPEDVRRSIGDIVGFPSSGQLLAALRQVEAALPLSELDSRLRKSLERRARPITTPTSGVDHDRFAAVSPASPTTNAPGAQSPSTALASSRATLSSDYQRREISHQRLQLRYLPKTRCLPDDITGENLRNAAAAQYITGANRGALPGSIEVSTSALTPLWLTNDESDSRKLVFVRRTTAGTDVVHQGFVIPWERLKPRLLEQITGMFETCDLTPVEDDVMPSPQESRLMMSTIPARLSVSGEPNETSAAAWRSVRGLLLSIWAAAVIVLAVAGWGVRSLVSLTERRLQFAYAVTHELRTPLTTFRLYTDMLSAGLVPDASRQEYLDTLNKESMRLSTLVEDVLEYARLENHKVRLNPVSTDADSLLRAISGPMQTCCQANGLRSETVNEVPKQQPLRLDVDLVNQITGVLVNNACRHARGSKDPLVLLHLGAENGRLHLDVIDSGPGIDRADMRNIFKPFRRGRDADVKAQGGIGLGLAIARSWAMLLGGRLDLAARHHPKYGGAHFRLTIPSQTGE